MSAPPGSPEAIAKGCICSPTLNRHGRGTLHGEPRFYYARKCPIHRIEADKRALAADEVTTTREPKQDDKPI